VNFKGAKDAKTGYAQLADDAGRLVLTLNKIVTSLDPKNLPQNLAEDLEPFIQYVISRSSLAIS
jgi:hypothetical protein